MKATIKKILRPFRNYVALMVRYERWKFRNKENLEQALFIESVTKPKDTF